MLTLTLLAVGKLKERYLREAADEYSKRVSAYAKLQIVELPEYRLPKEPPAAEIQQGISREGDDILAKIPARAFVVALCVEGSALSSVGLAEKLRKTANETSQIVFIIGGSYGLDERVKQAASLRLSMSEMTFPHQLARVVLLEQLYRICTINAGNNGGTGGKYHK